jgi:hypothetical protein
MQATHTSDSGATALASLSPVQAQVVAALAQGRTITTAAAEAGVHRNTIHNWFHEPVFKTTVESAQTEYVAILRDGMRDLAALALQNLRSLLEDPKTPPSVRLRTVLALLQRPQYPQPEWHLPVRIEEPRRQQVMDNLAELRADYDTMRMAEALQASAAPIHEPRPQGAVIAKHQEPQQPPNSAPIARSAPCPCGSGLKYKRCCGAASPGKFARAAA